MYGPYPREALTGSRWAGPEGFDRSSRDDSTGGTPRRNTDAYQGLYLLCNVRSAGCGLAAWGDGRQASTAPRLYGQP